jgi:hypothetical protein
MPREVASPRIATTSTRHEMRFRGSRPKAPVASRPCRSRGGRPSFSPASRWRELHTLIDRASDAGIAPDITQLDVANHDMPTFKDTRETPICRHFAQRLHVWMLGRLARDSF